VSEDGVLAEGVLNEPQWVAATIALERLRRLRLEGEMRNFVDWANQPGAASLADRVEVVALQ
jgi:hypothetical protein